MPTGLNYKSLIAEMRSIARHNPDFSYLEQPGADGACSYLGASKRTPGVGQPCIVGQALQNLGVPSKTLSHYEGGTAKVIMRDLAPDSPSVDKEHLWVQTAQRRQDSGATWGDAIRSADKLFRVQS